MLFDFFELKSKAVRAHPYFDKKFETHDRIFFLSTYKTFILKCMKVEYRVKMFKKYLYSPHL